MSVYELGFLGSVPDEDRSVLTETIKSMVAEFDLTFGTDIVVHDATSMRGRNKHAAFATAYFGNNDQRDIEEAYEVASASAPIIPVVSVNGDFAAEIPDFLQSIHGLRKRSDDAEMMDLATAMLECVGLLRRQRRVFVSYRRMESRAAALQLHDLLSVRGFDVFLDTHDIRPGEPFQAVLWQRLCDSDVLVMLDTPGYFESKWTRQEIGRARAKEIHVLRVIWPEHEPDRMTDLAETVYLDGSDLTGKDGPINQPMVNEIIQKVEQLRGYSIAARHMSISGKLRAEVGRIGGHVEGIGTHRAIALRLEDTRRIWAYPVVGVPTAQLLNDVENKAQHSSEGATPILVYDHVGIGDAWKNHLAWLDKNIQTVRAIKVAEAGWELAAWDR